MIWLLSIACAVLLVLYIRERMTVDRLERELVDRIERQRAARLESWTAGWEYGIEEALGACTRSGYRAAAAAIRLDAAWELHKATRSGAKQ